jgi:hypothetical protein
MDTPFSEQKRLLGQIHFHRGRDGVCDASPVGLERKGLQNPKDKFEQWSALAEGTYESALSSIMDWQVFI